MKTSALARMIAAEKERLRAEYDIKLRQAFSFCEQWYMDQAQIAVAEAFDAGPDEIKKFVEAFGENRSDFVDLWNADTIDCEYTMQKLDGRLREVCGDYFLPFEERYGGMTVEELRKRWG